MRCLSVVCTPPYQPTNAKQLQECYDLEERCVGPTNRIIEVIVSQRGNQLLGVSQSLLGMKVAEFVNWLDGNDEEVRKAVEEFEALEER